NISTQGNFKMAFHDEFRNSTVTNLTYATSAGTAVSTAGFGAQTYYVSLTALERRRQPAASDF
ncbi:MAG: hypothetical protein WCB23_17250, partial [Pseudolabrys sp.]